MPTIDFGTRKYVGGTGPAAPPNPTVGALAGSMQRTGATITDPFQQQKAANGQLNPGLVTPGAGSGYVGKQPTRQLSYDQTVQGVAPPTSNLPPTSTTPQTGQGGGQSNLPGASPGQPGQAQGVGRTPVTPGVQPPNPGILPVGQRPVQTVDPTARQTSAPPNPGPDPGTIPMPKPDPNTLKTPVNAPIDPGAGLQYGYRSQDLHPGGVTYANDTTPSWYAPIESAPTAPSGGDTTGQFATNFAGAPGSAYTTAINSGKYGAAGDKLRNLPTYFTVEDFNTVAKTNPVLAEQMSAKGGQAYRDAIMKANGWTNLQMNQFINKWGSGALPGITQENLLAAGMDPSRFGTYGQTPPPAPPAPAPAPAPAPPPTGYGYFDPNYPTGA